MTLVKVPGKSRTLYSVPILLTEPMKLAVDRLLQTREEVGISATNSYVFANSSDRFLRGHDCIKENCLESGVENPERITSTNLRKYVATVIQLFDLKDVHVDMVARHLGHDIRTHRNFYRLHEDVTETAHVAKMLLTINEGKAASLKAKVSRSWMSFLKVIV